MVLNYLLPSTIHEESIMELHLVVNYKSYRVANHREKTERIYQRSSKMAKKIRQKAAKKQKGQLSKRLSNESKEDREAREMQK